MTIGKTRCSTRLICGLIAGLAFSQLAPARAQTVISNEKIYSRDKIFEVIRSRELASRLELTLVAAHRGYWETYPENSWGAINAAGKEMGFEIVEADIKPALGGEPVVFHDLELDRVTNGHGKLSKMSRSKFLESRLRDRFGVSYAHSEERQPLDFKMLLDLYSSYLIQLNNAKNRVDNLYDRPGYVIALDVKGKEIQEAWPLVRKIYTAIRLKNEEIAQKGGPKDLLTNAFLIKIAAPSLPDPIAVEALIKGGPENLLNLCIVVNGKDDKPVLFKGKLVKIGDERVKQYKTKPFVSSFEVVYKYEGDPDIKYIEDPEIKTSIGNFLIYYEFPEGTGTSDAKCCSLRNTDPSDASHYIDYRGRWPWLAGRNVEVAVIGGTTETYPMFSILTMDRPDLLVDYLKAVVGRRNTEYILYKPK